MTVLPQWIIDFANVDVPDWVWKICSVWLPEPTIAFLILAAMVKCLLISFYCAIIYFIILLIKRLAGHRMSIRARYYSWYALLLSLPLSRMEFSNAIKLPFYDIFLGNIGVNFREADVLTSEDMAALPGLFEKFALLRPLLYGLTALWFVVIIAKCLRQLVFNVKLQRRINRQESFSDPNNLKQKAANVFGLRADKIHLVAADFIRSPVSYGVFRKTILLPHDYVSRYTSAELYLLLLHEMGHIRNHDTVKLQLLSIAECFIWTLHPMRKRFIRDSEVLCDNRVLGVQKNDRDIYGELMVRECSTQNLVKGLGFSDSFHTIKIRVESIYSHKPEPHRIALFAVAIAFILACHFIYASQFYSKWLSTEVEPIPSHVDVYYINKEGDERYTSIDYLDAALGSEEGELVFKLDDTSPYYTTNNYQLQVDGYAIYEYLSPYISDGLQLTKVRISLPPEYSVSTRREALLWDGTTGGIVIPTRTYEIELRELELLSKTDRYIEFIHELSFDERVYKFVAHWL